MPAHPPGQGSPIDTASAASPVGPPFISLLLDDERTRAKAVSTLVAQLAGPETRVIHVDSRLRALLTLDHAGDAVARVLAERQGRETQVVLLVDDAETLPLGTLRALQGMAPYFVQAGRPALRVAFVGHPAFRALVAAEEFAPLRQALGFESGMAVDAGGRSSVAGRARRKALQVYTLAALVLLAGVAGLVVWGLDSVPQPNPSAPVSASAAPRSASSPDTALPASVAALEQPPPMPPPPAETRESAILHSEFDAFLSSSGRSAASLTPAERDALVAEFLNRRASQPGASQPGASQPVASQPVASSPVIAPPVARATSPATSALRVVIHVAEGPGAAALAAQSQTLLDGQVGRLQTRHVAGTPKRPSIRYFRPEDAPAARLIERRLASLGLTWTIQDFTAAAALPSPGTIEVWLPRQP